MNYIFIQNFQYGKCDFGNAWVKQRKEKAYVLQFGYPNEQIG
jgi:hypothetical protein